VFAGDGFTIEKHGHQGQFAPDALDARRAGTQKGGLRMNAVSKTIHSTLGFWHALAALQNAAALFGAFFLIADAFDNDDLGAKHRATFALLVASYAACGVTRG
jgi:hypothetical protein